MPDEKMTLIEKLLNPAWRVSKDSEWADLDVEQTVETMREAAKLITSQQETLAAADHTLSVHGHIDADTPLAVAEAIAIERERCAQIADSMNSTQNIGDRIRYGLGNEVAGRK